MGTTKSELFQERQNRMAELAKAFDHPARVAILEYLLQHNTCICTELVHELPLSQTTITQHLKELKKIGFIKGEVEGPRVNYCIDSEGWEEARSLFLTMLNRFQPPKSFC